MVRLAPLTATQHMHVQGRWVRYPCMRDRECRIELADACINQEQTCATLIRVPGNPTFSPLRSGTGHVGHCSFFG